MGNERSEKQIVRLGEACMAMVDTETLATDTERAAAYAIVAVRFDPQFRYNPDFRFDPALLKATSGRLFIRYIDPMELMRNPEYEWTDSTYEWTMKNNLEQFERAKRYGVSARQAINDLLNWMREERIDYTVSNSPSFDHAILRHMVRTENMDRNYGALHFRSELDVRTMRSVLELLGQDRYGPEVGQRHDPIFDCINQIADVQRFLALTQNS